MSRPGRKPRSSPASPSTGRWMDARPTIPPKCWSGTLPPRSTSASGPTKSTAWSTPRRPTATRSPTTITCRSCPTPSTTTGGHWSLGSTRSACTGEWHRGRNLRLPAWQGQRVARGRSLIHYYHIKRTVWGVFVWSLTTTSLHGQSNAQLRAFDVCKPVTERTTEIGCWILSDQPIGRVGQPRVFWHLDVFPTRQAAETAKGPRGTVIESPGRNWLLTIEEAGWRAPPGGERVATSALSR